MAKKKIPSDPNPGPNEQAEAGKASQPPQTIYDPIVINSHSGLVTEQQKIFKRINENPEISRLFFINPVLAFKELNVSLSPKIADHVLRTLQHDTADRERRAALEEKLRTELGEPPQPNNPAWLARILFDKLKLQPLQTRGRQPTFRPPLNEDILKRLQELRPKPRIPPPPLKGPGFGTGVRVAGWKPSFQKIDLDAPAPSLPAAKQKPKSVSLDALFFYKDLNPAAHDLLELGLIQKRGVNFHSSADYRKSRSGQKYNAFHAWIKSVHFPEEEAGPE